MQIIGRSSSHFTRLSLIFAHELDVPVQLVPIYDMTPTDADTYSGNPALKLPILRAGGTTLFGALNICRKLAELAHSPGRIVWPEALRDDLSRNAQELVWHGMAAQVQLAFGTLIARLPADNIYFVKARSGLAGSLRWLDAHLTAALGALPSPRDLSVFEVSLFCLIEHLGFRQTVDVAPFAALAAFTQEFATRRSAQLTPYRFDTPGQPPQSPATGPN
jgi:glutathione S-transferase